MRSDAETIADAYGRTAAAGLARARFSFDNGWGDTDFSELAERLPTWMRVAGRVARPLWRREVEDAGDLGRDVEEGIVDIAGHRSAMCPVHRPITIVVGKRQWYRTPGKVLDEDDSFEADTTQPLWLLALLRGVGAATPAAPVTVRGESCKSFSVTADLSRASAATPGGLPPCETSRFEDLLALPLTVAIDDAHLVRRVAGDSSFGTTGNTGYVVELWDFGAVPALDWTRVPHLERPTRD